jgi:hypothetical protein
MIHHEQKLPPAEMIKETESEDVLTIKIVNDKERRSEKCFEVKKCPNVMQVITVLCIEHAFKLPLLSMLSFDFFTFVPPTANTINNM